VAADAPPYFPPVAAPPPYLVAQSMVAQSWEYYAPGLFALVVVAAGSVATRLTAAG